MTSEILTILLGLAGTIGYLRARMNTVIEELKSIRRRLIQLERRLNNDISRDDLET